MSDTQPSAGDQQEQWKSHRDEAAALHASRLASRQAEASRQARVLIGQFMEQIKQGKGPAPQTLYARSYNGKRRYRTQVQGWYLRVDRSCGVGTDGEFYLLTTSGGVKDLLFGAKVRPSDPPIVLGFGSRDGESIDISDALNRVLGESGI